MSPKNALEVTTNASVAAGEVNKLEMPYRVQVQGLEPARKNLMIELKAQVVEC